MEKESAYISGMLERTSVAFDEDEFQKVRNTVVAIFGLGGVGPLQPNF